MTLASNKEHHERLCARVIEQGVTLEPKVSWCQSNIGRRLWEKGRLLPKLVREATQVIQLEGSCSISDLQRFCRLPIRLACYLSANSSYELSRTPSKRTIPEDLSRCLLDSSNYQLALDRVKSAARLRSEPALIYGQRYITPESAVCRAALILSHVKSSEPRVAFLGDDDLSSVALASLSRGARITVIDIDKRVLETIQSAAGEMGLNINLRGADISEPTPADLKGQFDCFVADPYPTFDASFEMCFINRGIELLECAETSFGLVTFAPTHKFPQFRHFLLNRLEEQMFDIREIVEIASEYELIRGELTPLEDAYLEGVSDGAPISHAKSYVFISSGKAEFQSVSPGIPLESWLRGTRSHDLSIRLGGEERLQSELERTVNYNTWKNAYSPNSNIRTIVDVTAMMSDLTGCEESAMILNSLLAENKIQDFHDFLYRVTSDRALAQEGSHLGIAARQGSKTPYDSYSLEFELYLLSRIYESYFRGSSPLRAGGY